METTLARKLQPLYVMAIAELASQVPEKVERVTKALMWKLSIQIPFSKPERELQVAMDSRVSDSTEPGSAGTSPFLFTVFLSTVTALSD